MSKLYTLITGIVGGIAIHSAIEATETESFPSIWTSKTMTTAGAAVVRVLKTQIVNTCQSSDSHYALLENSSLNPLGDSFSGLYLSGEKPDCIPYITHKIKSSGSGFVIKSEQNSAFIVTLYPFVSEADKISVILHNKTKLEATILDFDRCTDLVVLKVLTSHLPPDQQKLPTLAWADSNLAERGNCVVAIGDVFRLGNTPTSGIIAHPCRPIYLTSENRVIKYIQHDAPLYAGSFGGPLLNMNGEVIGINAFRLPCMAHNFSIPSELASERIRQLIEYGRVRVEWLGVCAQPVEDDDAEKLGLEEAKGAIINSVIPDSPAAKANIRQGDIILECNGQLIDKKRTLGQIIGAIPVPVGNIIKIKLCRLDQNHISQFLNVHAVLG